MNPWGDDRLQRLCGCAWCLGVLHHQEPDCTLDELKQAYVLGVREGLGMFAWWKDGVQYVGTCGRTLKEVLEEIK